jgi:hypothetical protein
MGESCQETINWLCDITGGCGANRTDESLSGACGQTSAVARFWTDLDRGSIFLALCEVIGDPRVKRNSKAIQKRKAITHLAVQLSLNWKSKFSS